MSAPLLFSDTGCPFARRITLLLEFLGVRYEHRVAPPGQKPPGLEQYSPSLRVPLLVHEGLVLTESRVILDYLGDRYGFAGYPTELVERTRHVHAIAVVDDFLAPLLFVAISRQALPRLADTLDIVERATSAAPPGPLFLTFHLAAIWSFLVTFRPNSEVTVAIRRRQALTLWLDAALEPLRPDPRCGGEEIAAARACPP